MPTTIPGIKACHAVISDRCRTNRGDGGAFDEAVSRLRQEYERAVDGWKIGMGAAIHLVLAVQRPAPPGPPDPPPRVGPADVA